LTHHALTFAGWGRNNTLLTQISEERA
jgi:hypothetical protein